MIVSITVELSSEIANKFGESIQEYDMPNIIGDMNGVCVDCHATDNKVESWLANGMVLMNSTETL
ncbi:hypothetical protein CHS0354_010836 [Potamilus streckersoni]|uniref:Uncharacterized protein n=1 Tax=Potamilus streckersoni TaxID=2493646 RepID=A0AAE0TAA3_9BIVA|nr:hypothetical protein CHS0354_010836 [Potamilus streckersoni]